MPNYDYGCRECGEEIEVFHSFKVTPEILCEECGAVMKKLVSACSFAIRNTDAQMRFDDLVKKRTRIKSDLRENYGVENVVPMGGASMDDIYRDVKESGTRTVDEMQAKAELNENKRRKKVRDWTIAADKRVEKRTMFAREMKKKEAAKKRSIKL